MKGIIFLVLVILVSSCWAPRCPEKACLVKFEHFHEGAPYRGGSFITARKHWPWEKDEDYKASKRKRKEAKKKSKFKEVINFTLIQPNC